MRGGSSYGWGTLRSFIEHAPDVKGTVLRPGDILDEGGHVPLTLSAEFALFRVHRASAFETEGIPNAADLFLTGRTDQRLSGRKRPKADRAVLRIN